MTPDDRDLPHVRGDECPRCHAHDGEPHGLRCGDATPDEPAVTAVVALDFDGVVNCEETYRSASRGALIYTASEGYSASLIVREFVARVQRVCDETGAGVVVVSAWRAFFPADALARLLRGAGLTAPVLGAVGGVKMSGDLRASALLEWLAERPEVTRWCVIDDDVRAYGDRPKRGPVRYADARFAGRCIHPRDGITDADADAAIAILRGHAPATCGPVCVDADGCEVAP